MRDHLDTTGAAPWWAEINKAAHCDDCGTRLERIPGKGGELYDCPLCEDGGAA